MTISLPGCFIFFLESILANCNLFISPAFLYLYAKICHNISSYLLIFKDMCLAHAAILFFYLHICPYPPFPLPHRFPVQGQGSCLPPLSCLPKKVLGESWILMDYEALKVDYLKDPSEASRWWCPGCFWCLLSLTCWNSFLDDGSWAHPWRMGWEDS